jgi:PAS domain S-box-containing protein
MSNEVKTDEQLINELVTHGIIDAIGEAVSIQDTNFRILYQNQRHKDMVGDHFGKYCYNAYQGMDNVCDKCHLAMCFEDGWAHKLEQTRTTDRGVFHYEITGSPLKNSTGKIIAGTEVVRDITRRKLVEGALIKSRSELEIRVSERTEELVKINEKLLLEIPERKKIEKALREKEERFRAIAENAQEWIWEVDSDGKYTYSSPVVENILGYSQGEILGKHFYDLFHPDDRKNLKREAVEVFKQKQAFRDFINRNVHKNGNTVWLSTSGSPIIDAEGNLIGYRGADTDITDKKKANEQQSKSKEMYKKLSQEFNTLLDAIPDNLILLSPDLRIVWLNRAAASGFGRDASELTAKYCYKLCCSIFAPCENCPALKSFQSGEEENGQLTTAQGRVWYIRAFPVKDGSGVKNVIEVARDITARVRMEQQAKMMQTKLIHANKMTSLGTLVSGVVHEINNPNSYILSNAQLFGDIWKDVVKVLSKHYRGKQDIQLGGLWFSKLRKTSPEMLQGIIDGSLRINSIINTLKNFARQNGAGMDGKVDIRKTIKYSRAILANEIKKFSRKFRVTIERKLPPIKGNSQQIEQVLVNLTMNALQSLHNKSCGITISASVSEKSGFVLISVKDEGVGMTKDVIARATEPFFTTRLDSGGTGLGLSITYSIIKEHGGSLEFESEPGKGTTVFLELPVYG